MQINPSFELYHLLSHPKITRKKVQNYLLTDPSLERLHTLHWKDLIQLLQLTTHEAKSLYEHFRNRPQRQRSARQYSMLRPITIYDTDYPHSLATIPDPPLILYARGNRSLLRGIHLSVIGSRKPSSTAKNKINLLLPPLIEKSVTIVSGLAYGIDGMSHQLTLNQQGKTIAVLAFGFNHIYPKAHTSLYRAIERNGLLLTEYPPDVKPNRWQFPERNRIISGLSQATLIIEATKRSGTMITADQALEQGKDVFVVPDSIFLPEAEGCLKLLQEGAIPITSPQDLMDWWNKIS
ncbi:DNA-processing protein DprA [Allobacillus sp. GCM10007491]|uniref:DNA-processing protein DprA n=1 Tax=Allobacillus saliphilus TaxID=2912308 RepID=A0A941CTK4_9BACI|nr:DNA-processing protein DprA [Allobacillus saliphilus]MBR7552876.1 DNA-processing protein DprA [Allobacillus saliphilus]